MPEGIDLDWVQEVVTRLVVDGMTLFAVVWFLVCFGIGQSVRWVTKLLK